MDIPIFTVKMQVMFLEQESEIAPNHELFLGMEEEDVVFPNQATSSKAP